jgi:hypothetical protein
VIGAVRNCAELTAVGHVEIYCLIDKHLHSLINRRVQMCQAADAHSSFQQYSN